MEIDEFAEIKKKTYDGSNFFIYFHSKWNLIINFKESDINGL